MIFGSIMLNAAETNLHWNLAAMMDGAMIIVHQVREYFCVVMLQVSYSVISYDYVIMTRAETNIRNVTNEPFSKRTNIRIFVRFDE